MKQVDIIRSPTKVKGNGDHRGTRVGHKRPVHTYNGLRFLHGNGCQKWHDCLTCPFEKCTWEYGSAKPDEEIE